MDCRHNCRKRQRQFSSSDDSDSPLSSLLRLTDLPNECLFLIFKYVSLKDLVSLCLISQRLRNVIYDLFFVEVTEKTYERLLPLSDARNLKLDCSIKRTDPIFASILSKGCVNDTLTYLYLNVPFPENISTKNVVFSALIGLSITDADYENWMCLWENSPNLKTFSLRILNKISNPRRGYEFFPRLPSSLKKVTVHNGNFDTACLRPCVHSLKYLYVERDMDGDISELPVLKTLNLNECHLLPSTPILNNFTYRGTSLPVNIVLFLFACQARLVELDLPSFPPFGFKFLALRHLRTTQFERYEFDSVPNLKSLTVYSFWEPKEKHPMPESILPFEAVERIEELYLKERRSTNRNHSGSQILLDFLRRAVSLERLTCAIKLDVDRILETTSPYLKYLLVKSAKEKELNFTRFTHLKTLRLINKQDVNILLPPVNKLILCGPGKYITSQCQQIHHLEMYHYDRNFIRLCLRGGLRTLKIVCIFADFEKDFFRMLALEKNNVLFALYLYGVKNRRLVKLRLKKLCSNLNICILKKM